MLNLKIESSIIFIIAHSLARSQSIRQKNIYDKMHSLIFVCYFSLPPYFRTRLSPRLSFPQRTHADGIKCRLMNIENLLTKSTCIYIQIYLCMYPYIHIYIYTYVCKNVCVCVCCIYGYFPLSCSSVYIFSRSFSPPP